MTFALTGGHSMAVKRSAAQTSLISTERIDSAIVRIRGRNVLLDTDLAVLYGVTTKRLVQAMKRNRSRFPSDFMFH